MQENVEIARQILLISRAVVMGGGDALHNMTITIKWDSPHEWFCVVAFKRYQSMNN